MTTILLIRHATTNAVGKHLSGRAPGVFLNEEGLNQAQKLAQRLSNLPITAIYSSSLERAIQTAEPLADLLQLTPIINEDFIELNFGEWTNAAFSELQQQKQFQLFNSFRSVARIPGGELMLEAQARVINGLQKLCWQHPQQTIAVVSHSDLIKAAVAYYAGIHLDMFQRLEISPASVSIIQIFEETARILLLNDTGEIKI
ncbi:phosphoglycerate mutase [Adhaeribacter arboris]|uniref:Phosphoglycerate mutase n=1 Tax=Adhaeribacter arboris TaxID=2072846 RepID=A0A2T2YN88_9BACT|nr:histidine phosphatase family protein [Adhaeribacter arboris]PSR56982.1 phosphoglycerate mutase [Adhaeribacter arboris]